MNEDFYAVFLHRERTAIWGFKKRNIWIMTSVLSLMFVGVGLANIGQEDLALKLNDPFIQWLKVEVPYQKARTIVRTQQLLARDSSLKQRFLYDRVDTYVEYPLEFLSPDGQTSYRTRGRSLSSADPLMKEILSPDNLIAGRSLDDDRRMSLVVTKRLLETLGQEKNPSHLMMPYVAAGNDVVIPIPIAAVVKELPDLSEVAYTPFFYLQRTRSNRLGDAPFDVSRNGKLTYFIRGNQQRASEVKSAVGAFFTNAGYPANTYLSESTTSYVGGFTLSIIFSSRGSRSLDEFHDLLMASPTYQSIKDEIIRTYHFDTFEPGENDPIDADQMSIYFQELDSVEAFSSFLFKNHDISIDDTKLRDKSNYLQISRLANLMSTLLIAFSVMGVAFYLYSVLSSHFEKIRANLGTLKAFGLANKEIQVIYLRLVGELLLLSLSLAMVSSSAVLLLVVRSFYADVSGLPLVHWSSLLAVFFLLVVVAGVLQSSMKNILEYPPGPLVYAKGHLI